MKTFANNPAVKFSELNEDQRLYAAHKLIYEEDILPSEFLRIINGHQTNKVQFFITSPTSVGVRKK